MFDHLISHLGIQKVTAGHKQTLLAILGEGNPHVQSETHWLVVNIHSCLGSSANVFKET